MVQRFTRYIYLFTLSIIFSITLSRYAYAEERGKEDKKPVAGKISVEKATTLVSIQTSYVANRHLVSPESNAQAAIITEEAIAEKEKAKGVFEELDRTNRYIDDIVDKDLQVLPIGFKKTVGNGKVEVAVSRAEFYSQYAELTMYVRMTIPGEGGKEKILFLGADKVRFTAAGGISSFKAVLLGDFPLIESEEGYSVILKGAGGLGQGGEILDPNQTYAQVDCGQFKEAQIIAQVLIPRKTIIPLTDGTFLPIADARVTCDFKARIVGSLDNLVGSLTFRTPFSAPSADGFAFKVVNASFDISNAENPTSMGFPVGYVGDKTAAWQGVFIQNFTVYLPKQFKKKGSTARTSLSALNVLIDRTGFSGIVEANTPIFSINEGSASGWAMSLDRLKVSLVQNKLTEGSFAGQLRLPIAKKKTLIYTATIEKSKLKNGEDAEAITGLDYKLKVVTADDIDFDLFKAKGKIYPGSEVNLDVINDEFVPDANLSGELTVSTSLNGEYKEQGAVIRLEKIVFRDLRLNTGPNPICVGYFKMEGEGKVANFPITIETLELRTACKNNNTASEAALFIKAKVAIAGKSPESGGGTGFSASFGCTIKANKNEDGDWRFKEIAKPTVLELKGDLSSFSIMGGLELYDNEDAGNGVTKKGFRGAARLIFKKPQGLDICAEAEFGSTSDGDNYFYVAGSAKGFPPISFAGPIAIDGFAGGLFYHMMPTNTPSTSNLNISCSTGQQYVYNYKTGFGFKAGVNLTNAALLPQGTFDGYAGFEIVFNRDGGLASLGMYAQAQLLAEVPNDKVDEANSAVTAKAASSGEFDREPSRNELTGKQMEERLAGGNQANQPTIFTSPMPGNPPLAARVGILLNFNAKTFDAQADVYVNVGYLKGKSNLNATTGVDKNLAGRIIMHFDPETWYIHAGTPEQPMRLVLENLPRPLNNNYISASTYLMIGYDIPPNLPPMSDAACDFFKIKKEGNGKGSLRENDKNAVPAIVLNKGEGFAFGLNFDARLQVGDDGDLFTAVGEVGVGLDILYTTRGNCGKATAKGRAYGYVDVDVQVDGWKVAGFGVGVLLEGGAPAPTYFTGIVAVKASLIGFEIHETFEVKVGDETKCL